MPHLPEHWVPQWRPPVDPRFDACSAVQIDAEYAACEAPQATNAACTSFRSDPVNAICESCLFSDEGDAFYGPIIEGNGIWQTNTPGCIALLDGDRSAGGCGARVQAANSCYDDACNGCLPYEAFATCRQRAINTVCRAYYLDSICLRRPEYANCTEYATNEEYFRSVARVFCSNGFGVSASGEKR